MKDKILEEVWKAKESVASYAPGDFKKLAGYIKKEADSINQQRKVVNLRKS